MIELKAWAKSLTVVALATAMMTAAVSETYAVLIGINDYPDAVGSDGQPLKDEKGNPINHDLMGAVNDVDAVQKVLEKGFSVKPANIKKITNKQASGDGFVTAMKDILSQVKSGDQFLFFYSGHGGQVDDKSEPDGVEEVIVLADNQLVPGDFFGELAAALAENNIDSSFIFDSCYSGGMSRDGQRVKFLNLVNNKAYRTLSAPRLTTLKTAPRPAPKAAPKQEKGEFAFLFAGQEDQPTIDISGLKDVPAHGVFTLFLTTVLEEMPKAPSNELIDALQQVLKELKFEQVPRAEFSTPERAGQPILVP